MQRRSFLAALGAAAAASGLPLSAAKGAAKGAAGSSAQGSGRLTLLYTNDTHSHIDPFDAGSGPNAGKGGMARRATLISQLRQELGPVLVLDAGDVFQGTPYFNQYKGHLDYQLMSLMGYDVGTLGNHDFDNGVEGLTSAMQEAKFQFVNCNFDMKGAPELQKRVQPYVIKSFPGVKVGITGVGVDFRNLVSLRNHAGVEWRDPAECLRPVVRHLREKEKVDLVVVLSHLGYDFKGTAPDDLHLAKDVPGIDVIIGGHSHTFLAEPTRVRTEAGETLVTQVGFGGLNLGRLDFVIQKGKVASATGRPHPVQ